MRISTLRCSARVVASVSVMGCWASAIDAAHTTIITARQIFDVVTKPPHSWGLRREEWNSNTSTTWVRRRTRRREARPPAFDDHGHAVFRPKGDQRPRLRVVPGRKLQTVGLRERRHDQLRLNQRELVAD